MIFFILAGEDRNEKEGKRVNMEDRSGPSLWVYFAWYVGLKKK